MSKRGSKAVATRGGFATSGGRMGGNFPSNTRGATPPVGSSDFVNTLLPFILLAGRAMGPGVKAGLELRAEKTGNWLGGKAKDIIGGTGGGKGGTVGGDGGDSGGARSSRGSSGGSTGSFMGRRSLCNEKPVSNMSFSTNIDLGLVVNTSAPATLIGDYTICYTPMVVKSGYLFEDISGNDLSDKIISEEVWIDVFRTIQDKINYNVTEYLTVAKFKKYMQAIIDALQVYYTLDSILAYQKSSTNANNPAMNEMNVAITSQVRIKKDQIAYLLERMVIPPNLLAFICYMYQNFRFDASPASTIYRLSWGGMYQPSGFNSTKKTYVVGDYLMNAVLNSLNDPEVVSFNNYMTKAFPEYVHGCLPPSCYDSIYDTDFMSFWINQNMIGKSKNAETNQCTALLGASDWATVDLYYPIIGNSHDGLFLSLFEIYKSGLLNNEEAAQDTGVGIYTSFHRFTTTETSPYMGNKCSTLMYEKDADSSWKVPSVKQIVDTFDSGNHNSAHMMYTVYSMCSMFDDPLKIRRFSGGIPAVTRAQFFNVLMLQEQLNASMRFLFAV